MAFFSTVNNVIRNIKPRIVSNTHYPPIIIKRFAARRGTRTKALKKKQEKQIEKVEWSADRTRQVTEALKKIVRTTELNDKDPIDNVYYISKYKTQAISILDAIRYHRENLHPTMLDVPEGLLELTVELDMTDVKNRFVKDFDLLVDVPHPWIDKSLKELLVFCKTEELQQLALECGASKVGDLELINKIQKGEFSPAEYDHILCHSNIYLELSLIRGLIRLKYPMRRDGTMGDDLKSMIHRFRYGIKVKSKTNPFQPDLAVVKTPMGSLKSTDSELEANFRAIFNSILSKKPSRPGPFITWIWCTSPHSSESFKIDPELYMPTMEELEKVKGKGKMKAKANA